MTKQLIKTTFVIFISGLISQSPLYAMGKQPDKKYNAAPRPASQTAAYTNPFATTSNQPITPRTPDPTRNSNTIAAPVKTIQAAPADAPYGTQVPQGHTGISQTSGNSSSPDTSGGVAPGSIGK